MNKMSKNNINLLFCGDFITRDPGKIILSDDFKNIISECNIRCLDLEGVIPAGDPIIIKGTSLLDQSSDTPAWCEKNGFNVISLANNHAGDYGENALRLTMEAFQSAILVGAGSWDEAYKVKTIKVNGLHIGFLSVAQCEFGILNDKWMNRDSLGCAWINYPELNNIIKNAKQVLDFLFVITHAGIEFLDFPLPEWRDRYKELIDSGADAVIGGHPHVPQGWEVYKGKPIFYSLGNFYFDKISDRKYWNNGISVILTINDEHSLSFRVINTIKTDNEIKLDTSQEIQKHNREICTILTDEKKYMASVNKACLALWRSYEASIMAALNCDRTTFYIKDIGKYLIHLFQRRKPEYRYILHYLRCESHRFAISRALKLLTGVKI